MVYRPSLSVRAVRVMLPVIDVTVTVARSIGSAVGTDDPAANDVALGKQRGRAHERGDDEGRDEHYDAAWSHGTGLAKWEKGRRQNAYDTGMQRV